MTPISGTISAIVAITVVLFWIVFASIFVFLRSSKTGPDQKRGLVSRLGVGIQGLGFASVWMSSRFHSLQPPTPPRWVEIILAVAVFVLGAGSCWLEYKSVRALGKQWAVVARIMEGHELVTEGPYRFVRNPIYLGMLGMLLMTALAFSRWQTFIVGTVLFAIGTTIRIRTEEKLLRATFGKQFDGYVRRVPAFFPRLF
jgi:protein-S-isoprenylcysteine O-methyltransferase Ste14